MIDRAIQSLETGRWLKTVATMTWCDTWQEAEVLNDTTGADALRQCDKAGNHRVLLHFLESFRNPQPMTYTERQEW